MAVLCFGLMEWSIKNIVFDPLGHHLPKPCTNLQNSCVVDLIQSLLFLPFSRATRSYIFPGVGSMAAPAKSWASDVLVYVLK